MKTRLWSASARPRAGSIRRKIVLVAMLASTVGLLLAGLGFITLDQRRIRREMASDLTLMAKSLGHHGRTPLLFNDDRSATETLESLKTHPTIVRGLILTAEGDPFARYPGLPDSIPSASPRLSVDGFRFEDGRLHVYESIRLERQQVGAIYLESTLDRLEARQRDYGRTALITLLAGLLISGVIALRMQRVITEPISRLSETARRVTETKDYSVRASKHEQDEVGLLIDAFNEMLNQIETRDEELSIARDGAERAAEAARLHAAKTERTNIQLTIEMSERQRLKEQLIHAQKMESVGQLAGGVAHDFNNLLTVILGWSDVAESQAVGIEGVSDSIHEIRRSAERAANLTRQLLAFARREVIEPRVVNLNSLVEELKKLLRRVIGEDIDLTTDLDPALRTTYVDPGQLEQVLVNLAVNARDAMPTGGTLALRTRDGAQPRGERVVAGELDEGREYILVTVEDTGSGMSPEVSSRIFEPFFTTKEGGKGTGLGLAMCYGLITQSEGLISVETELGRGTTFKIYLPVANCEGRTDLGDAPGASRDAGSGTVLVVEDEAALRELMSTVLRGQGYNVVVASNGIEGLVVAANLKVEIDLLITDVVMPRMGGLELARELADRRPELRILFTSGYPDHAQGGSLELGPLRRFLRKPFTPALLAAEVHELVGAVPVESRDPS